MKLTRKELSFVKMHGCKNDYIYIDCTKEDLPNPSELSIRLSDRHSGIGGDGIILICPSVVADFRMRIFNADGSEAEMCGNGIRCLSKFVYDFGLTDKTTITIETGTGDITLDPKIKTIDMVVKDEKVVLATVDMGEPVITSSEIPLNTEFETFIDREITVLNTPFKISCVSMGNPHAVTFVEDVKSLDLPTIGPHFEHHSLFPQRINTEFIKVINKNELEMRVWERGSGETMACGTGACAAAYAAMLNGYTEDEVTVHLLGGDLTIRYDRASGHIFMTGAATTVFTGSVLL